MSCSVNGCKPNSDETITYFRFPRNPIYVKMWLSRCGKTLNTDDDIQSLHVCSKHFRSSAIKQTKNGTVLRQYSFPTKYLPVVPNSSSLSENKHTLVKTQRNLDQASHTSVKQLKNKGLIQLTSMAANCCIVGCPTVVDGHNLARLFPFPRKHTNKFDEWMDACIDSKQHILRLNNPLICPLHFSLGVRLSGELRPMRNLTPDEIKALKKEIASINQLVAEWLILSQQNNPDLVITANMLKAKAKEVAVIMKMHHFDVELGWLHGFELYLNLNGIKHWRKRESSSMAVNEEGDELGIPKDCDLTVLKTENETTVELDSEQSIQTYREALEKVKLLEDYVKRTQNRGAMELVTHMQEILINTLE